LLFSNQEYHTKNGPYEHDINCHSLYHFPTSISNDSCFTSFDLHGSTSHYLDTCREVEPLQPSLMVMSGPHYLGMPPEYDQIHFPSQDSHIDLVLLIENSSFKYFKVLKRIVSNFMIQSLNGWKNLTWEALFHVSSFNPSSCLL